MRPLKHAGSQFLGGAKAWYIAGGATVPIAAYRPKGAASLAASYVNIVNPGTYNAAPGTAPTFAAATGWGFTGTQFLNTGILSAANMTVLVRFSGSTGNDRCIFGSRNTTNGLYAVARLNAELQHSYNYGPNRVTVVGALAGGVVAIAGAKGYLNGAQETATLDNVIATPLVLYVGAANIDGVTSLHFVGNIQAVAIYSSVLTAAQVLAISTAMAAL
jgi:hypothetical protein